MGGWVAIQDHPLLGRLKDWLGRVSRCRWTAVTGRISRCDGRASIGSPGWRALGRDPSCPGADAQSPLQQGHARRAVPPRRGRRSRLAERRRGLPDARRGRRASRGVVDADAGRRGRGVASAIPPGRRRRGLGRPDRQSGPAERGRRSLAFPESRAEGRPHPVGRVGTARGRRSRRGRAQRQPARGRRPLHLERPRRPAPLRQHGGARDRPGEPPPARPGAHPRGGGAPGRRRRVRDGRRAGPGSPGRHAAARDRVPAQPGAGFPRADARERRPEGGGGLGHRAARPERTRGHHASPDRRPGPASRARPARLGRWPCAHERAGLAPPRRHAVASPSHSLRRGQPALSAGAVVGRSRVRSAARGAPRARGPGGPDRRRAGAGGPRRRRGRAPGAGQPGARAPGRGRAACDDRAEHGGAGPRHQRARSRR